jgi:predicted ribosome quality control (RQC) complex YloA/Tae2 family protein
MKLKKFDDFDLLNEEVKLSKIAKREEFNGYEILIGRNAEMNDILTTEIADKEDLWFHASQVPGSHIIIKNKGEEIPKEVIRRAGELAAINSRGKGKVKVVWTKAKYVTKEKGHEIGEVNVDYNMSNFITVYI